jgi:hypothetical protein
MSEITERGQRADQLLQDPLIVEALDGIEQTLRDQWEKAATTEIREELWYTFKGMQRFKQYLTLAVEQGVYETALMEKENESTK